MGDCKRASPACNPLTSPQLLRRYDYFIIDANEITAPYDFIR